LGDPARFEDEVVVLVPQDVAFHGFLDTTHYPKWQTMVRRVVDQSGPGDVPGTTYVLDHGLFMKLRVTILDVRPPAEVVLRQQGLGQDQLLTASFVETAANATTLRMVITLNKLPPFGGTSLRLGGGAARKGIRRELDNFRRWIETSYARTADLTG
jgi:hypothetical protein